MIRCMTGLRGYILAARDGEIGRCRDFLFDDQDWSLRFMVADTGKWLSGKKVLVAPISLGEPDWAWNRFPVTLTRQQIEDSPLLDEHLPVSRQYERQYHEYYDLPMYWGGAAAWGSWPVSDGTVAGKKEAENKEDAPEEESDEKHLQSMADVLGYHISARDGEVGHLDDLIVDAATWTIRQIVIDTRNWIPGRRVLLSPDSVNEIDLAERKLLVDRYIQEVRNGVEYDPGAPINKESEERLYDYYGRPREWDLHR
jgi:hypothetical protein